MLDRTLPLNWTVPASPNEAGASLAWYQHSRNFATQIEIDITKKTFKKLTHILNSAESFPGLHIFVQLLITSKESGISNEALP